MDAECRGQILRGRRERDEGIARCRANPLAEPICWEDRGDRCPRTPTHEQSYLADRWEDITQRRDQLVLSPAIRDDPTGQPGQGRHTMVQAIDDAELHSGKLQVHEQIHRQNAGDHFRRDIGKAADQAEQPDCTRDDRTRWGA